MGANLTVERSPGWIERTAVRHISKLPKLFLYGPVALILAWLLAPSGRGELELKGAGVVALALWLSIDLWHVLLQKKWQWRFVTGWTGTSLLFIVSMTIMWWWLGGKLSEQRIDVALKLSFEHYVIPGMDDNPMFTKFTVVNNSGYALSGKHKLVCYINLAVGDHGTSLIEKAWEGEQLDATGKWTGLLGGAVDAYRDNIPTVETMQPGGDAETDQCLKSLGFAEGTDCIDTTLIFWYSLETQPTFKQEKDVRYVATKEGSSFVWSRQPLNSNTNYCRHFYKAN
jgi:hypothetical protein